MSSTGYLIDILSIDDQAAIVQQIIVDGDLNRISEVLDFIDLDTEKEPLAHLFARILQLLKHRILDAIDFLGSEKAEYDDILDIIDTNDMQIIYAILSKSKNKNLNENITEWVGSLLSGYLTLNHKRLFESKLQQLVKEYASERNETRINDLQAIALIIMMEQVILRASPEKQPTNFNEEFGIDCVALLGTNNSHLSSAASKLMRWQIKSINERSLIAPKFDSVVWSFVCEISSVESSNDLARRQGLLFILRTLINGCLSENCIQFLKNDDYWQQLQFFLDHEVHECRKLGLSALKFTLYSLPKIEESFANRYFEWNPDARTETLDSWRKFITFYEMVALDTALNQIEAVSAEIVEFSDACVIHPSWALLIFSTGARAAMESVRKCITSMIFTIRNPALFSVNINSLKKVILPLVMEAQFYVRVHDSCPHGDRVLNFVENIIYYSFSRKEELLLGILELLVEQGNSYDISRIYVSLGILNYLRNTREHCINRHHLNYIKRLFAFDAEDEIAAKLLQETQLQYLLYIDSSITAVDWISAIAVQVKQRGDDYGHLISSFEEFRDLAVTRFNSSTATRTLCQHLGNDNVFDFLSCILFNVKHDSLDLGMLIEASKCRHFLPFGIEEISSLLHMLIGTQKYDHENAYLIVQYPGFPTNTWQSLQLGTLFDSVMTSFNANQFKFFVACYCMVARHSFDVLELSWETIERLYYLIKESLIVDTDHGFKERDQIYGVFFELVETYLTIHTIVVAEGLEYELSEFRKLTDLMKRNVLHDNGNYNGNLHCARICEILIGTYASSSTQQSKVGSNILNDVTNIIFSIWSSISSGRLILKERGLHLQTIKVMFCPSMLFRALFDSSEIMPKLIQYGLEIVKAAQSRRGFLPVLASEILNFHISYSDYLTGSKDEEIRLMDFYMSVATQLQTTTNSFTLRPILAALYDKVLHKLSAYDTGIYHRVYGPLEESAKIHIIESISSTKDSFKHAFIQHLIDDSNLLCAKKATDGIEQSMRLTAWQICLLCMLTNSKPVLKHYKGEKILESLKTEASSLVRICKEWALSYIVAQGYDNCKESDIETRLFAYFEDHSMPILAVSAERVCYQSLVALIRNSQSHSRILDQFITSIIPNATTNKPLVRHFSNSLMLYIWPQLGRFFKGKPLITKLLRKLYENALEAKIVGKFRAGDAIVWDIYNEIRLTSIFGGLLRKLTDHNPPYISKELFTNYLKSEPRLPIGADEYELWLDERESNSKQITSYSNASKESKQIQTKSGAWETVLDIDGDQKLKENIKRSHLIVVASLVDKPPNLGGICRLCDVLGVGLMTVNDLRVRTNPQFKNVAVTADRWMSMQEVVVDHIIDFMREKKAEGYTLIGLEQTDNSIRLNSHYRFPEKSLILLGIEAHGIPGHLLSELDLCVEIEQHGVVRSMNIQTATAIVVHSYSIQHM